MTRYLPLITAAVLVGCAHHPVAHMRVGVFFDSTLKELAPAQVVAMAGDSDFILIGEAHDNACDHEQEARLVDLIAAERPTLVGMEMVAIDQQPVLDRFLSGQLPQSELAEALDWKKRWGFSFELYAPIFAAAARHTAPVVGLNAPESIKNIVRDGGLTALSTAQKEGITPELIMPAPEQEAMLREAMASHAGKASSAKTDAEAAWQRFIRVQSFWDSQMAFTAHLARRRTQRAVVVIAGGGHVEHGWGIGRRLKHFDANAHVMTVMPWHPDETPETGTADVYFQCSAAQP